MPVGQKTPESFQFLLLFDRGMGSPKVHYFMVNPWDTTRVFPKMNTMVINKVKDIVGYRTVVMNNCLYLIGGKDWNTGQYLSCVWKFDPATNHWCQVTPLNVPRCRHTATVLNGHIYVMGGESKKNNMVDFVERYNPDKDKWVATASLPRPRADHASCVMDGKIYLSGGVSNLKHQSTNIFWVYDPSTNAWTEPVEGIVLPEEREKHCMVCVDDNKILLIAGRGFDTEKFVEKDEDNVSQYNLPGEKGHTRKLPMWDTEHPSLPNVRSNAAAQVLGTNVWLFGGKTSVTDRTVQSVCYYNTRRRRWLEAFPLPSDQSHTYNLDCCLLTVPTSNKDFSFADRYLYDRWIMW